MIYKGTKKHLIKDAFSFCEEYYKVCFFMQKLGVLNFKAEVIGSIWYLY